MDAAVSTLQWLQLAVDVALAVAALRLWRNQRGPAGAWLAATFSVLAGVGLAGLVLPEHSDATVVAVARKSLIALLLLFPYCLYRFATSFDGARKHLDRLAVAATAGVILVTALVPEFPEKGDPQPAWVGPYVLAILAQWAILSVVGAVRLWRGGRDQAALARRRMRTMAAGALVVLVALCLAVSVPSDPPVALQISSQMAGLLGVGMLFVGFAPPAILRVLWRQPDALPVRDAEVALMQAHTVDDIAAALLPRVARLFGGKGAVLADEHGQPIAAYGLAPEEAVVGERSDLLAVRMKTGWLAVQSSPYTPFFGREETELLEALAIFTDLAIDRARLFARERESREEAEQARSELETFVYTVSHDLKSPLVSLVGFMDYLRADLEAHAYSEVPFYLDRMDAGARYMQALIQDLLELSRIGRVQHDTVDVALDDVAREGGEELRSSYPGLSVVVGDLPVVRMNPLRARQLFTNLIGNAATHAGQSDVHVRVGCEWQDDGAACITVTDDGKGIPAAYREKVFGVFERLGPATGAAGTGIGLSVCRKIVEQFGGAISVGDSVVGARIELLFPPSVVRGRAVRAEASR